MPPACGVPEASVGSRSGASPARARALQRVGGAQLVLQRAHARELDVAVVQLAEQVLQVPVRLIAVVAYGPKHGSAPTSRM